MSDLRALVETCLAFRDERDWARFHTGRDLAMALAIESAEALECFLWKGDAVDDARSGDDAPPGAEGPAPDADARVATAVDRGRLADELADVFYCLALLSARYGIDLDDAVRRKLAAAAAKYPVERARGSNRKYDDLPPAR